MKNKIRFDLQYEKINDHFKNAEGNFIKFKDSLTSYLANQRIKQREQQIIDQLQSAGYSMTLS